MKRVLALLTLSAAAALAQQPAPASTAPAPASTAPAPETPSYQLKNRSSFTLTTAETRAPFLPIGFQKSSHAVATPVAPKAATPVVQALELRPEHFTVSSVLSGQPGQLALATINNRSFAEGEVMQVVFNGVNTPVLVRSIRADGKVILEYNNKQLVVELKRQEVIQKLPGNAETLKGPNNTIIIDTQPSKPVRR